MMNWKGQYSTLQQKTNQELGENPGMEFNPHPDDNLISLIIKRLRN